MKKQWLEGKNENYQQYIYPYKYYIDISILNGINYFAELNDKFKNYQKFLKIENKQDLELKIKVVEIKFHRYDSDENLFEKKLYSKIKSLNESLEEKDFYVFDLAPGGRSIEWEKIIV